VRARRPLAPENLSPTSGDAGGNAGADARGAARAATGAETPSDGASALARWRLDRARWPLDGDPPVTPCRLTFDAPLRLVRKGQLITTPTLADIVQAIGRRLSALVAMAGPDAGLAGQDDAPPDPQALITGARTLALATPQGDWVGNRRDFTRYSRSQQGEVELHGVAGHLDLPRGPGSLWPLLMAALWIHVGKGTVFGLGQMQLEPLD
jgi:hypothetical protein